MKQKKLYPLIDQVVENHEYVLIKGTKNSAILILEKDWQNIEETLFVASNIHLSRSLLRGLNTKFEDCKLNTLCRSYLEYLASSCATIAAVAKLTYYAVNYIH